MGTLLATYAIACAAVSAYAAWLAVGNARFARRLEQLKTAVGEHVDDSTPHAEAA